jgi:hypothetical protein
VTVFAGSGLWHDMMVPGNERGGRRSGLKPLKRLVGGDGVEGGKRVRGDGETERGREPLHRAATCRCLSWARAATFDGGRSFGSERT